MSVEKSRLQPIIGNPSTNGKTTKKERKKIIYVKTRAYQAATDHCLLGKNGGMDDDGGKSFLFLFTSSFI